MEKKLAFIFSVGLICCGQLNGQAGGAESVNLENPYTASIVAGFLPQKASAQKTDIWQRVAQKTESLIPQLKIIDSLFAQNRLAEIVQLLEAQPKLKELIIEHVANGLVVVKAFARLRKNKEAIELLVQLNKKHPMDQEVAFLLAQCYEQTKDLKNALRIIDEYLKKTITKPSTVAFLFLKMRIYLGLGEKEKALTCVQEALALQPEFHQGWFIAAKLKEEKGELENAVKDYANYLDLAISRSKTIPEHILFKAVEAKLLNLMFNLAIKKHPSPQRSDIERCRNEVVHLFRQGKYKGALKKLDRCMSGESCNEQDRIMKIQLLGTMNKHKEAAQLLQTWLLAEPKKSLWFETLHLLYFAGLDSRVIIKTLQTVCKKYPDNLLVHLYLADMFTRNAQAIDAIRHHTKALTLTNEPELKTSILFQLGLMYYDTKQFVKMRVALENGRGLGLDYPPLLNLLAYHYATRGNNLAQAQELMQTVLTCAPDNPHFLDTHALILYKQQNYAQACKLFETIAQQEPDDATVNKHLAKTYLKLGRYDEAAQRMERVAVLTYDKQKKKKYQLLAKQLKGKTAQQRV